MASGRQKKKPDQERKHEQLVRSHDEIKAELSEIKENQENIMKAVLGPAADGYEQQLDIKKGKQPSEESQDEPTVRQDTVVDHETDGGRAKLSTTEALSRLWDESIDFRDIFSNVLNVKYLKINYWPHLAEQFGIDKITYETFSQSDIVSPTERVLEYLETRRPKFSVKDFCASLRTAEAHEVCRVVEDSIKVGDLSEKDRVTKICDKAPKVLDTIILKLDCDDRLWKNLARAVGIPQETYSVYKRDRTDNSARLFFELLRTEAPRITVKNLKTKLEKLEYFNLIDILDEFRIKDDMLLKDLSEDPDAKSAIESVLNKLETKFLWNLASLYQNEGLMKRIHIETTFRQQDDVHNPTCIMIKYVLSSQPKKHTIEDLIIKLTKIGREDCLVHIEPYLKGGKQDIDKITERIKKNQGGSSEVKKQAVINDDEPKSVPATSQSDENNYVGFECRKS